MAPPSYPHNLNYPGYCMVYPESAESAAQDEILKAAIAIGTRLGAEARVVAILPDTGRNYLSTYFNEGWRRARGL